MHTQTDMNQLFKPIITVSFHFLMILPVGHITLSWFLQIKPLTMLLLSDGFIIQEPGSTKTYERTSTDEKSIVDNHCYHITTKFAVGIKEKQETLPTL